MGVSATHVACVPPFALSNPTQPLATPVALACHAVAHRKPPRAVAVIGPFCVTYAFPFAYPIRFGFDGERAFAVEYTVGALTSLPAIACHCRPSRHSSVCGTASHRVTDSHSVTCQRVAALSSLINVPLVTRRCASRHSSMCLSSLVGVPCHAFNGVASKQRLGRHRPQPSQRRGQRDPPAWGGKRPKPPSGAEKGAGGAAAEGWGALLRRGVAWHAGALLADGALALARRGATGQAWRRARRPGAKENWQVSGMS